MSLSSNTEKLQILLGKVKALPDENTVLELPKLTNPGTMVNVQPGYQFIGEDGNVVEGDMPIVDLEKNARVVTNADGTLSLFLYSDIAGYYDGREFVLFLNTLVHERPDGTTREINLVDNGVTSGTMDGLNTTSVQVQEGYTEGGEITFDNIPIESLLGTI